MIFYLYTRLIDLSMNHLQKCFVVTMVVSNGTNKWTWNWTNVLNVIAQITPKPFMLHWVSFRIREPLEVPQCQWHHQQKHLRGEREASHFSGEWGNDWWHLKRSSALIALYSTFSITHVWVWGTRLHSILVRGKSPFPLLPCGAATVLNFVQFEIRWHISLW